MTTAEEQQRAARNEARWWSGATWVTLTVWVTVLIVDGLSPYDLSLPLLGLVVLVLCARIAYLSARIDLADANTRRLAELMDGGR